VRIHLETPIGRRFSDAPRALAIGSAVALGSVAADMTLVAQHSEFAESWRWLSGLAAAVIYLTLTRGDMASCGLTLTPVQGWRYWGKVTLAIGLIVACWLVLAVAAAKLMGKSWPIPQVAPDFVRTAFVWGCIRAPLLEEPIYRLALCVPLASRWPRSTVVASGVLFAYLHVLYGNSAPDNQIAGFFLAWAYLKSGSILVPLGLHSLGNLCALSAHVLAYQTGIQSFP
jgi:membrane protease YdiL (CAAX protease family)